MTQGQVSDRWERGNLYERYIGRWSRQVAPNFLAWLALPGGLRWLDVGCGTGALCAALVDRCSPQLAGGIEPSLGFIQQPFLGGQGPAPSYVKMLSPGARARLKESLRRRVPIQADGSIAMTARAWAVRAIST